MANKASNRSIALSLLGLVLGMVLLTFASVPLYRIFCQITGFGGTTQKAEANAPEQIFDRTLHIRFNADVYGDLPWKFEAPKGITATRVGEHTLVFFHATNLSDQATTGTAAYNVTPNKVGEYFDKIQCFCFDEQTLAAGESVEMPVSFYIDPAILNDVNAGEVDTITLSYTFFKVENPKIKSKKSPNKG